MKNKGKTTINNDDQLTLDEEIAKSQELIDSLVGYANDMIYHLMLDTGKVVMNNDQSEVMKREQDGRLQAYRDYLHNDLFNNMSDMALINYAADHISWLVELAIKEFNHDLVSDLDALKFAFGDISPVQMLNNLIMNLISNAPTYVSEKKKLLQLKKIKRRGY